MLVILKSGKLSLGVFFSVVTSHNLKVFKSIAGQKGDEVSGSKLHPGTNPIK
jgi:hypothetical protein